MIQNQDEQRLLQQALEQHRNRNFADANSVYQQLLCKFPNDTFLLNNLGVLETQRGNPESAFNYFSRILTINPNLPDVYSSIAYCMLQWRRFSEALTFINKAISLQPHCVESHFLRGVVFMKLFDWEKAVICLTKVLSLKSDHFLAWHNRGLALRELRQFQASITSFKQALAINPDYAGTHFHCAISLMSLSDHRQALAYLDRAIQLKPDYADAYVNRGTCHFEMQEFIAALACYDKAISLNPNFAEAYLNRGGALKFLNQNEAYLRNCDKALAIKPDFAEAYVHKGVALMNRHSFDQAAVCFDQAISLKPDLAKAYINKSQYLLMRGEYVEGWKLYEWRWRDPSRPPGRKFKQQCWLGEQKINDKVLLIHPEQGLGDFIQCCRYLPLLEKLAYKIIVEVPSPLVSIISTLTGNFIIVEQGDPLPDFDIHCPIMSLPLAFNTTVATIPASVPYLYANADKRRIWRERLGNKTKPKIGLVWQGSTINPNDYSRSIPLELWEPILQLPLEFYSLQKEVHQKDIETLRHFRQIVTFFEELNDFSDTAALIAEMDLVISVDTAVAHLAGALAKPVWILLPFTPDFRWGLDSSISPWYPTATMLRQSASGDWPRVMAQLVDRLEKLLNAPSPNLTPSNFTVLQSNNVEENSAPPYLISVFEKISSQKN
ncbi:MAG: tetratricopeptide repeat protein [Methylomonas sp.]|jgi:tetratricopeptide (TPR) repeat protein